MKNRCKKIKTILICLISFFAAKSSAKDFVISTGESKSLALKGNTIWIEKKNIITGQVKGSSLIITGKEVGASYVKIKDELIKLLSEI